MELPPSQKLANLKNHAELFDPADITYAEFVELYTEVAIKLYDDEDRNISSDYSNG